MAGNPNDTIEPSALEAYWSDLDRKPQELAREPSAEEEWASVRRGDPVSAPKAEMQMARGPTAFEGGGRSLAEPPTEPGRDTGWSVGGKGSLARAVRPREDWQKPSRPQTLAEAIDEAAPLDRAGPSEDRSALADTLDNAKDPWEWMARKGYVAPEGVDLKSRAAASRKDIERAQLGLAKDWINSPEGAREMQSRLAGEKTPTHVWDQTPQNASVQQRYAPGSYFKDADQLYADQANSMPRYGIPNAPGANRGVSSMARGEFAARVAAGEDPQEILYQERRANMKRELDARRERAFKADFVQHRKTPLARPFWTWGTSDEEAAQKAWEDDRARRGL